MTNDKKLIGQTEYINFPEIHLEKITSRVDTGAQTSAIWASNVKLKGDVLSFQLFDEKSPYFSGVILRTKSFTIRKILSSNGVTERRYAVKILIVISGRKIRASFTLANRSSQKYPVLVGRNVLRGKFLVDVEQGHKFIKTKKKIMSLAHKEKS